jgi:signal transduction histidine kinase
VKNVHRASLNLDQRIDELIELSRGELGILKISILPVDYRQLLLDSVAEMGPVASAKGLALVSDIPELPPVNGDYIRLRQVINNLLNNAIKYTAKGSVSLRAVVFNSESVLVQVKDTGKGIEKEEMENLFDPFLRKTREGQDLGGLGIGLALSKIFIDLHQGKIWAESTPSSGSTFSFTVPVFNAAKDN